MDKKYDSLKLENQLCFPLYALSRLVVHEYQSYFEKMNITYPQYLVLMVLWERNSPTPVNDIAKELILNTNTITPLLKRMETQGLITRKKGELDTRQVLVSLTDKAMILKDECLDMTCILGSSLVKESPLTPKQFEKMHDDLWKLIRHLQEKQKGQ
ncbi:MAG: MarR family transcriptional regulator [Bacteroidales bacterium]